MTVRRALRRTGAAAAVIALLLVVAVGVGVLVLLYRPLPTTDADLRFLGLDQRAEIVRDAGGIPHLFARTTHDLFYLQGYAVAQDRLFQIELLRRAGRGTLAAVIGPDGSGSDAWVRSNGLAASAEAAVPRLGAAARVAAQAYADGVNKFLEQHGESLPLELTLVGIRPAPWSVADSLVVLQVVGTERASGSPLTRILSGADPADNGAGASCTVRTGAAAAPGQPQNAPLLEADPRLAGWGTPALWYAVAITGPEDEAAGFAVPGVPGILIGHDRRVAWSLVASPEASLPRDLDAILALARAGDSAAFIRTLAGARGPLPGYCVADGGGHVATVTAGRAIVDPPGGLARLDVPAGAGRGTPRTFHHPLEALLPFGTGVLLGSGPYDPPAGGALERLRVDLGDPDAAGLILPLGESGQPAARHHGDQTAPWRAGELVPLALTRDRIDAGAETLVLRAR